MSIPNAAPNEVSLPSDREIVVARVFRVPRTVVFRAWSNAEYVSLWWRPVGFTLPVCEIDFRSGGKFRFVMRAPDGDDFPMSGTYLEVIAPQRIIYTDRIDKVGWPNFESENTVTFSEDHGETRLTFRATHETKEHRDIKLKIGMPEGLGQTFDCLDRIVTAMQETQSG